MQLLRLTLLLALALAACGATTEVQSAHDLTVRLERDPSPALLGRETSFRLGAERDGETIEGASFQVRPLMPGMGHAGAALLGQPLGDGASQFTTSFAMAGRWELEVTVSLADLRSMVSVTRSMAEVRPL